MVVKQGGLPSVLVVVVLCLVQQGDAWVWGNRPRPCDKVNCVWGSWGTWGSCSHARQSRHRTVIRAQSCGGTCDGAYVDSRICSMVPPYDDSRCKSSRGVCQYTSAPCSRGYYVTGRCGGPVNRRCCIPSGISDRRCTSLGGVCQYTSIDCVHGSYVSGKCGGPYNRRCCLPACFETMCGSRNVLRKCDAYGCGHYNAPRNGRRHKAVDIECRGDADVYAPFAGKIVGLAKPYRRGKSCCNKGILIRGIGRFAGWRMKIFYVKPTLELGQPFREGQIIGKHVSLHCSDCYRSTMTDLLHIELYKGSNAPVDPTPHLICNSH